MCLHGDEYCLMMLNTATANSGTKLPEANHLQSHAPPPPKQQAIMIKANKL